MTDHHGMRVLVGLALLFLAGAVVMVLTAPAASRPIHPAIAPGVTAVPFVNKEPTP